MAMQTKRVEQPAQIEVKGTETMTSEQIDELDELERGDAWEDEPFMVQQPRKPGRAVVSVALAREDFALVARIARENGMKTSEFIREAALDRARGTESSRFVPEVTITNGGFRTGTVTEAVRSVKLTVDEDSIPYITR
jgi:hypothetical protein